MNRGSRTARYAAGTAVNPTAIQNLYIYGGALWAAFYLFIGIVEVGTISGAINVLTDFYITKLFGWPWDELLLAETLGGLIRSHFQTWVVGWVAATIKYGVNSQ